MANNWSKDSWRNKPVVQVPEYDDQKALEKVEKRLSPIHLLFLQVKLED